ncbi:hypothetical protein ABZ816_13375 [Actinosynnema sp. NPDC047251]|uniref:hypothetical protein n=1 Tax=Saccharothrix espanaensis TaxID=103731 RepID=UPI0002F66A07|nr:hypothetical protein [Saccharothrix espanaensis]
MPGTDAGATDRGGSTPAGVGVAPVVGRNGAPTWTGGGTASIDLTSVDGSAEVETGPAAAGAELGSPPPSRGMSVRTVATTPSTVAIAVVRFDPL